MLIVAFCMTAECHPVFTKVLSRLCSGGVGQELEVILWHMWGDGEVTGDQKLVVQQKI